MEVIGRFFNWCEENNLSIIERPDGLFELEGYGGKFILLTPKPEAKIIDADCCFNLTDEEDRLIDEQVANYIVFEFGGRFYYTAPKLFKNSFNETKILANFDDFKYIGAPKLQLNIPYTHLGVHSEYELLNGSHNASLWVKKAKFLGHTALGICDKDTLAGTLAFQTECKKKDIKPILGMTATIAVDFNASKSIQTTYEMKFFAMNEEGWQNLLQINKAINVDFDGFIPEETLFNYTGGLIAIFGTNSQLFAAKEPKAGKLVINKYKRKFSHLFAQIDTVEFYDDKTDLEHLEKIKNYLNHYRDLIEPVMVNDSYYVDREMYQLKEYLNKVDRKAYPYSEEQHYKNIDEINSKFGALFSDVDGYAELLLQMIHNTVKITDSCDLVINTGEHKLPKYEFVEGQSNEDFFFELIMQGFEKKILERVDEGKIDDYKERMFKELNVIVGAGFIDYFLILWDIVGWAKENSIMVGTGRGSIGGCLIAYLIDITEVDPIKHDLLFERFMNEARISGERAKSADAMPDVDVDFEAAYREDVKTYIYARFGQFHTCSIGSYTRLKLKAAIKDFARVKGLDFKYVNYVTKDIDDQLEYSWKDLITYALSSNRVDAKTGKVTEGELYKFIQKFPEIAHCIKWSLGQCRSASIHASAVIIVPNKNKAGDDVNIFNWLPVRKIGTSLISEWEGKYCERAGFLKEDILSLNQLDKFKKTLELIERNYGEKILLEDVSLEDENTYELFGKGFTEDVFQFGSGGLKMYSAKAKPDNIEDLIAMNALWRPGPMESNAHTDFALIKHGKKKPQYDYKLKVVTEKTQGLYIYQEQIMQAVVVLGGFSLVDADVLRTQIKKFDKVAMRASQEKFIQGAIANGCPHEQAVKIWDKLVAFSGYGFNKSHSAAYAKMAYWSQWLKANYPLEFWTSSLNFTKYEEDIPRRIGEMKRLRQGISVKPPSVNKSGFQFDCDPETNTIYWSLTKIKSLGVKTVEKIIASRPKKGFTDYQHFVSTVPKKDVNKGAVATLILCGAFDEIEGITEPIQRMDLLRKHYNRLAEPVPEEYYDVEAGKSYFWINKQRQLTGFGDIDFKSILLGNTGTRKLADLFMTGDLFLNNKKDYKEVVICGRATTVAIKNAKNGKDFARISILSNNELIWCMIWEDTLIENEEFINNCVNKVIAIKGKVRFDTWSNANVLYSYEKTVFAEL